MKTTMLMILGIFLLVGCINFQVTSQEKQIAGKILARHIGFQIAEEYPEIAVQIAPVLEQIASSQVENSEQLTEMLVKEALNQIDPGDPLLESDLKDLCALIKLRIPEIKLENERVKMIKIIAQSLGEGLRLGGEK